ncbi:carbohydrate ABC transporter membrane protein 2, CUT1 family [Devosia enhydra]|uniref:Maltose/maltodextrin transport system permease protein MalG n=1 Tax=Devosia enhydra TaxID=665118 RepID=A0A1K2HZH0_9HYPH|nr:carbohydrate ABC transporter permease [Devosia enhydra]SFZ85415.1 carbohydrate ABC transporter membrane protein 2, CUT1 family [Devosia enhydra]
MTSSIDAAAPSRRTRARRVKLPPAWAIAVSLLFALLCVVNLLPVIWGILTSLKSQEDLFRYPPTLLDFTPTLENYERVITSGFLGTLQVTILYACGTVLATLALALPAAYAFDRFEFPLRSTLLLLVVASIPLSLGAAALLIPNYIFFTRLGLTNAWFTLPLIYTANQLPMAIWIVKGTLETIPRELDEAALIDGSDHFGILWRIILPLSRPALGAAGVLAFVGSWNEFVVSSVMVDNPALRPVQPAIYNFIGYFGREWGPLTAAAMMGIVPILLIFILLGRQIVSGLTRGSVKG